MDVIVGVVEIDRRCINKKWNYSGRCGHRPLQCCNDNVDIIEGCRVDLYLK